MSIKNFYIVSAKFYATEIQFMDDALNCTEYDFTDLIENVKQMNKFTNELCISLLNNNDSSIELCTNLVQRNINIINLYYNHYNIPKKCSDTDIKEMESCMNSFLYK